MNNKAFTLIELLAVIVILGILSTIATLSIVSSINTSKQKAYDAQVKTIEEATARYYADYALSDEDEVKISTLVSNGYLNKSGVINPKTNKIMDGCVKVEISGVDYTYTYDDNCGTGKLFVSSSGNDNTGDGSYDKPYKTLQKAYSMAEDNGVIELLSNISQTSTLNMSSNKVVLISGSGSKMTISRASGFSSGAMISISSGTVTFENIIMDGNNISCNYSLITNSSTLNLNADVVNAVVNSSSYSAIVNNGTMTISGATISGNTNKRSTGYGGAITNKGNLTINSSILQGNQATYGGAIYNSSGRLTLNNINIDSNTATSRGGALYLSGGTVTFASGFIKNNTARSSAGGIYKGSSCQLVVSGGNVCKSNSPTNSYDVVTSC